MAGPRAGEVCRAARPARRAAGEGRHARLMIVEETPAAALERVLGIYAGGREAAAAAGPVLGVENAGRRVLLHQPDRRGDPAPLRQPGNAAGDGAVAAAAGGDVQPRRGAGGRRRLRAGARARARRARAARAFRQPAGASSPPGPTSRNRCSRSASPSLRSTETAAMVEVATGEPGMPPQNHFCAVAAETYALHDRHDDAAPLRGDRQGHSRPLSRQLQRGPLSLERRGGGGARSRRRRDRGARERRRRRREAHARAHDLQGARAARRALRRRRPLRGGVAAPAAAHRRAGAAARQSRPRQVLPAQGAARAAARARRARPRRPAAAGDRSRSTGSSSG